MNETINLGVEWGQDICNLAIGGWGGMLFLSKIISAICITIILLYITKKMFEAYNLKNTRKRGSANK